MSRRALVVSALVTAAVVTPLAGQAVPQSSPAARVPLAYRRTPALRVDPFRHVLIPHWGLVLSTGAGGENNAFSAADVGALLFLGDSLNNPDGILLGDVLDALALVPRGEGVGGLAQGEGGVHLGGPFGRHFSLGLSGQGRLYGAFEVSDGAVALLRDGNAAQQQFPVGNSGGTVLATAEVGAHGVIRLGPMGGEDGALVSLGLGGRYVAPLYYAKGRSTIDSRLYVSGDSVRADVEVETSIVPVEDAGGGFSMSRLLELKGSGVATDFLVRVEWPTSGLALEAMVANLGTVTVEGVEREAFTVSVASTNLKEVVDSLEAAESTGFVAQGIDTVDVTLPRIVRFSASAWANRILQLDASATLPVGGEFATPLSVDLGSTWRLVRSFPLRVGMVLGGRQSVGYTAGFGVETRNFFFQASGASLGGVMRNAKGAAGRLELGFFF